MRLVYAANWVAQYLVSLIFIGDASHLEGYMPTASDLMALSDWCDIGPLKAIIYLIVGPLDLDERNKAIKELIRLHLED